MNNIAGYDSILNESWNTLHQANHDTTAYHHRAIQLTNWKRLRDFISLGVAPGLLASTTVWDNTPLRNLLIMIAGICSISSWLWYIFGSSYNWDIQLQTSIDVPSKLKLIIPEIKEEIEIFNKAKNQNNIQLMDQSAKRLKKLKEKANSLHQKIVDQQVHVKPWMNLLAQQDTMRFHEGQCGVCYQKWIPGSDVLNSDKAKEFIKNAKNKKVDDYCEFCGQRMPNKI